MTLPPLAACGPRGTYLPGPMMARPHERRRTPRLREAAVLGHRPTAEATAGPLSSRILPAETPWARMTAAGPTTAWGISCAHAALTRPTQGAPRVVGARAKARVDRSPGMQPGSLALPIPIL